MPPLARLWERFCDAIGRAEWKEKPEWKTPAKRSAEPQAINAAIAEITWEKPSAHWIELFEEAGVPCGPIYTIDQVFDDPQVRHLGIAAPVHDPRRGDIELVGSPLNMHDVPKAIRTLTLGSGHAQRRVLRDVGYSDAEMETMRADGVI